MIEEYNMEIRLANEFDVNDIMEIIKQAQEDLRKRGIDQWQNGYPNKDTICKDIEQGYTYVLTEDSQIIGTAAIIFDGEETYNTIYDGQWLSDQGYVVIHRIAIHRSKKGKGYARMILEHVKAMCKDKGIFSIKIDTHEDNRSMQRFLQKNGFSYCGIIYLLDGGKRLAFELDRVDKFLEI